jgi:NADH dehydrogenase
MDISQYASLPETPSTSDPSQHRVLIVGGGAAGLHLASKLGKIFGRKGKISVTLLDRSRIHVWKPLLHEVAAGAFDSEADSVELIAHAKRRDYRYRIGAMIGIDRARRKVFVAPTFDEDGAQIIPPRVLGYDTLVIAVGSLSNDFGTPGVAEHAITLDTLDQAVRFNRRMIDACLRANAQYEPIRPGQLRCAIVGAGATGVELAAELHKSMRELASYNLDNVDFDKLIQIELIEAGPRILLALPDDFAAATADFLKKLGIRIHTGTPVTSVSADGVTLKNGEFIASELIVWAAGIKAPDFLKDLGGLEVDRINRLIVKPTLQTTLDENIFAIGDCANCILDGSDKPLPPRAQTAQQQADFLVKAVKARLNGKPLTAFKYRDLGSLVSLSDYKTFGLMFRGFRLEGLMAKLAYRSLHKMHLLALYGVPKVAFDTAAAIITSRTEPRIKLH